MSPRNAGIGPVSDDPFRDSSESDVRFRIHSGAVAPVKLLFPRNSTSRLDTSPISGGIDPVKRFCDRSSVTSDPSFPTLDGIDPVMLFVCNDRYRR